MSEYSASDGTESGGGAATYHCGRWWKQRNEQRQEKDRSYTHRALIFWVCRPYTYTYVRGGGVRARARDVNFSEEVQCRIFVVPSWDRTVASKALDDFGDPMPSGLHSESESGCVVQSTRHMAHDRHPSDHLDLPR
jgi:hypothetical protein